MRWSRKARLRMTRFGSEGCIAAVEMVSFFGQRGAVRLSGPRLNKPTCDIQQASRLVSAAPFYRPIMTLRPRASVWVCYCYSAA